ncbi:MAG: GTPase RsgA [Leptospiraceae bacterium]|nr:GTPase RsgA [Leptospiraceae bacterium]
MTTHTGSEYRLLPLPLKGSSTPRRALLPGRFQILPPPREEELLDGGDMVPVVGDLVAFQPVDELALIQSVLPRRSLLRRKAAGSFDSQGLAANVDLVLIVNSMDRPLSEGGLLRYLAICGEVAAHIVFTGADLIEKGSLTKEGRSDGRDSPDNSDSISDSIENILNRARALVGAEKTHLISSITGQGVDGIASALRALAVDIARTGRQDREHSGSDKDAAEGHEHSGKERRGPDIALCCLLGPSGAGKSTLINALMAGLGSGHSSADSDSKIMQQTGAISEATGKGKHTTVRREWIYHPDGYAIIDSPGLREVGLDHFDDSAGPFAAIKILAENCAFRDCSHGTEPGCAVRAAVEAGEIAESLLQQYRTLSEEAAVVQNFRRKRKKEGGDDAKLALRKKKDDWIKQIHSDYKKRPNKRDV